jgi:DNA-binding GntR family transcriptional regulator
MAVAPRYREIADDLRRKLAKGDFPVGTQLPGISALQKIYDVPGLNTIRQAQALLQREGLITSVQGRGTFVVALPGSDDAAPTTLGQALAQLRTALTETVAAIDHVTRHLDTEPATTNENV